jgi:hypothetical protein
MIPTIWLPVVTYMAMTANAAYGPAVSVPCFVAGIGFWTFLEYAFHRFLFHIDGMSLLAPVGYGSRYAVVRKAVRMG